MADVRITELYRYKAEAREARKRIAELEAELPARVKLAEDFEARAAVIEAELSPAPKAAPEPESDSGSDARYRVFEVARDREISSAEAVKAFTNAGVKVKNHQTYVTGADIAKAFGG